MWLLIRARSNPKETAYKAGDIVEVRPDGCNWGSKEGLPSFYRVQITDLPYDEKYNRILQRMDESYVGTWPNGEPRYQLNRIRLNKLDFESLPTVIKNRLKNTGMLQVTKAQVVNYFKNNYGSAVDIENG